MVCTQTQKQQQNETPATFTSKGTGVWCEENQCMSKG